MPAFRAGGLDAGFEKLFRVRFSDDPENLSLIMEADRRGCVGGEAVGSFANLAKLIMAASSGAVLRLWVQRLIGVLAALGEQRAL